MEYTDDSRDPYRDLADLTPILDFSAYAVDHPIFTHNHDPEEELRQMQKKNTGVLGLLKVRRVLVEI